MDSIDKELNYLASRKAWLDVESKEKGDSYEESLIKAYDFRVKKTKACIALYIFLVSLGFIVYSFLPTDTQILGLVSLGLLVFSMLMSSATVIYGLYCYTTDRLESLGYITKMVRTNTWTELVHEKHYLYSEDPKYTGQKILSLPKPYDQLYTERKDILEIYMKINDKRLYVTPITLQEGKKILEDEVQYRTRKIIQKRIISDGLL